jgi:hypothetical protein
MRASGRSGRDIPERARAGRRTVASDSWGKAEVRKGVRVPGEKAGKREKECRTRKSEGNLGNASGKSTEKQLKNN